VSWEVREGDCIAGMAAMPAESVDAICSDPPYGISLMGSTWDTFDAATMEKRVGSRNGTGPPSDSRDGRSKGRTASAFANPGGEAGSYDFSGRAGRQFQGWCEAWAREALRVLKPGGHMLVFGGTRTFHRMTCGIEDAGFEIRDCLSWLYGCLTPDVEVLTADGWKRGIDIEVGDRVAQFDPATEAVTLAAVARTYRAPYAGPMRAIRSHDTDQLLTPNHRVVHEAQRREQRQGERRSWWDGRWTVAEAADVPRSGRVRFPVAGYAAGPGIGEDYAALLGWVWTEGHFDRSGTGVRVYQSPSANPGKADVIDALLRRIAPDHRRYDRERPYTSRRDGATVAVSEATWYFTGDIARRVRADLPGKRPTFPLLWRMTLAERRAFLDAALAGDGSRCKRTGSQQFYAKHRADLEVFQAALTLTGQRGRITMRHGREGGSVSVTPRAATELQTPKLRRPDEHYQGDVWCIGVPTGAFIARRNGLVFVTGNSGFPKSLDVSKAITAGPRTAEAATWEGWGTALKPAWEPIIVARKPLAGTVAQTVLTHGTGALNIDGCRLGATGERLDGGRISSSTDGWDRPYKRDPETRAAHIAAGDVKVERAESLGRWPANVALDDDAAALLDEHSGELTSGTAVGGLHRRSNKTANCYGRFAGGRTEGDVTYGDTDGASRFFYTAKASGAERNAGLSSLPDAGMSDDGYGSIQTPKLDRAAPRENWTPRPVKNIHPTVKPLALMRWLVRLVTPPDGLVLDPFTGSGTTGCAAVLEGFRFIGIEREQDYLPIARARIAWWAEHPEGLPIEIALQSAARQRGAAEAGQSSLFDTLEPAQ
jgi:DNA modification methylase